MKDKLASSVSKREYETIAAKLAYVKVSGEYDSFRIDWHLRGKFKTSLEMIEWKIENVYISKVKTSSYNFRLNKIAGLPQVSIKPKELHYLEYYLLMGELPVVVVDMNLPTESYGLNRKWETASVFFRLDEKVTNGAKFSKLAEEYTKMMPEWARKKYGQIKPPMLRKAHSRGKVKARRSKELY